jgi:hypothetical protein
LRILRSEQLMLPAYIRKVPKDDILALAGRRLRAAR